MEIISDRLLEYLPFSAEPLLLWGEETDLYGFLSDLTGMEGTIVTVDGHKEAVSYEHFGDHLFHKGKRDFRKWAHRFTRSAEESVASYKGIARSIELPDFYEGTSFGRIAKYIVAWEGLVHCVLSSGAFFSIAHTLESLDDLKCSLTLASQLRYKHSLQVLRGFLEDLVLPIYFAMNSKAYSEWKANNFRTGPLRGPNGVLKKLVNGQVLDEELANHVSELYADLNSFIHGSERRLINKGHYTRTWVGLAFNMDDYLEWCTLTATAVTLAVHLLKINLAQWERLRANSRIVCPICHNSEHFSAEEFVFGGEQFTKYSCQSCGDEMTHNYEGRQTFGQTIDGELFSYQY